MNLFRSSIVLALLAGSFALTAVAQKPTLVRNQDEPGRNPYQSTILFNQTASTCPNNFYCEADFPPVPAGFRLVVTHVSATYKLATGGVQASATFGSEGLFGTVVSLLATPYSGSAYIVSSPVTYFVEPGARPSFFLQGNTIERAGSFTASATVIGYLVAIP